MKDSLFTALAVFLVASCIVTTNLYAGEVDIDLDVSLGSEVGDNISSDEILPFWAQVEVGYEVGSFTPYAVYGHTSSADINGGDRQEYAGEFYGVGAEVLVDQFFVGAQAVKYADNTFERETSLVQMYEVGLNAEVKGVPFRVAAFYENATSGYLERMGIKFGYEFDLK